MEKWRGKVALVTGASAGIGAAVAEKFVQHDMKVVGCARNMEKLSAVAAKLNKAGPGEMWAYKCDMKVEEEILKMFEEIDKKYGKLHVLVNNAGHAHDAPLLTGSTEDWNSMMNLNVISLCISSREAVKLMDKCGVNDGHIINMNSVSGHSVDNRPGSHFYQITKYGVTAMTEGLRQELILRKSRIRVTSISPGFVKTEFPFRMFSDDQGRAEKVQSRYETILTAEDIADEVVFALSAPARVNICEMIVRPVEQP